MSSGCVRVALGVFGIGMQMFVHPSSLEISQASTQDSLWMPASTSNSEGCSFGRKWNRRACPRCASPLSLDWAAEERITVLMPGQTGILEGDNSDGRVVALLRLARITCYCARKRTAPHPSSSCTVSPPWRSTTSTYMCSGYFSRSASPSRSRGHPLARHPPKISSVTPSAVSGSAAYHNCLTLLIPASDSSRSWPPALISSTVKARTPSRTSARCALQTTGTMLFGTAEVLSLTPLWSFSVACTRTSLAVSRQAQRTRGRGTSSV